MALRLKLTAALAASLVLAATAAPQAAQNISLLARINLSTFGSQNGNSCWGYVSPSGREYAIMGLNNKVAFVEITNPSQPNWFASIPHGSSLWADVKVYRNACYVVTEGSGHWSARCLLPDETTRSPSTPTAGFSTPAVRATAPAPRRASASLTR
jgi:hypothetical protein